MGLFEGIETAQIGKGGFYFKDGSYIVDIVQVITQKDRKGQAMFIVEAAIAWSDNNERRAGMVPSWVVKMSWDAALGHIKGFLAACNGVDPNDDVAVKTLFTDSQGRDITQATAEFVVSSDNPYAGVRVALEVTTVNTKSGGEYSLHKWKPHTAPQVV